MLTALRKMLVGDAAPARDGTVDDLHLAAAALMVEVATVDERFDTAEREHVLEYVAERFGLSEPEAAALLDTAQREVDGSAQLYGVTAAIRNGFEYDERVALMESLWRVVLADGRVDPYEDQLLRRIAGLIYVTDRDRGLARKRAEQR